MRLGLVPGRTFLICFFFLDRVSRSTQHCSLKAAVPKDVKLYLLLGRKTGCGGRTQGRLYSFQRHLPQGFTDKLQNFNHIKGTEEKQYFIKTLPKIPAAVGTVHVHR